MSALPIFLVMAGGALGAGARYLVAVAIGGAAFPYATLAVNVAGGLMMGALVGLLAKGGAAPGVQEGWRLFVGVGLLGGFTTFSAFSLELVTMAEGGEWGAAALYALASVVGAALALVAGLFAARALA